MARRVNTLYGKYRLINKEVRFTIKGLTNTFIDTGKKQLLLEDVQELKDGIEGIMFLSTNRRTWEIAEEPDVYNSVKDTVLIRNSDIIMEIKVDTLKKFFKKIV